MSYLNRYLQLAAKAIRTAYEESGEDRDVIADIAEGIAYEVEMAGLSFDHDAWLEACGTHEGGGDE